MYHKSLHSYLFTVESNGSTSTRNSFPLKYNNISLADQYNTATYRHILEDTFNKNMTVILHTQKKSKLKLNLTHSVYISMAHH